MSTQIVEPHTAQRGLSSAEVAERVAAGQVNVLPIAPSRTVREIIAANLLTRFNFILGLLLVVILFVAPIQDAFFGLVLVVNAAIGIVQELRAKHTLEKLKVISAPRVTAIRNGRPTTIVTEGIVVGDLLLVASGDQIVVDGKVQESSGIEVDESLLTGESDPVAKRVGDTMRSGSVVMAGSAHMIATKVGTAAYASQLALEAKRFTLTNSELKGGIDTIMRWIGWGLLPIGGILMYAQRDLEGGYFEAAQGAVAGMVAMIPQGLVLLTSVAFAVAVIRLGRHRTLVQELPSVEMLARVDTICFDKTGTLTKGRLELLDVHPVRGELDRSTISGLGALARADRSPNATVAAIAAETADPGWSPTRLVAFSSARGWSGAGFHDHGIWFIGRADAMTSDAALLTRCDEYAKQGHRVLILSAGPDEARHPKQAEPHAIIVLGDELRPEVIDTISYFRDQGVATKVISGDHPATVGAIARGAGLTGEAIDATKLPSDDKRLGMIVEQYEIFGRVTPHTKQRIIRAMQANGHIVAMTGDGVNDVLALKDADIGIAMGSGSHASRAVAQMVLLDSRFDALPKVVDEGRRIIANIERVANLFLTKTVYAILIVIATAVTQLAFPFLPRHLSLVGSLTIGIPGFFLALEKTSARSEPGFLRRAWKFALPTGTLAAAASFAAYGLAQSEDAILETSRSTATMVLAAVGLFALAIVSRPLTPARQTLVAAMGGIFAWFLISPSWRVFWALPFPRPVVIFAGVGIAAITGAVMYAALRTLGWYRLGLDFFSQPQALDKLRTRVEHRWQRAKVAAAQPDRVQDTRAPFMSRVRLRDDPHNKAPHIAEEAEEAEEAEYSDSRPTQIAIDLTDDTQLTLPVHEP